MIDTNNCHWLPGEYVWPFILGAELDLSLLPKNWYPLEEDNLLNENAVEKSYIIEKPDMMVSTENDVIVSVSTHELCYYKKQQLIGMQFGQFLSLFGLDPNLQPDENFGEIQLIDELQTVYSIDHIGAQIWTRNGIIRSIIASIIYEDDEATIRLHPFREQL